MKRLLFNSNKRGKFSPPPPRASKNATTISLNAIKEENFIYFHFLKANKKIATTKNFWLYPHKKCDIVNIYWGYFAIHMTFSSTKKVLFFNNRT